MPCFGQPNGLPEATQSQKLHSLNWFLSSFGLWMEVPQERELAASSLLLWLQEFGS